MKVKIIEYKIDRGKKFKVQSHNLRKGKWKVNPWFDMHKRTANGGRGFNFVLPETVREYEVEK